MPFASRFVDRIDAVTAADWQALAGTDYPFLRHEFLQALEASGSVGGDSGWLPRHLLVEQQGRLVAALPLYLKQHSWGEYVFDWRWAEAWQHYGLAYYPKLVAAIPFTPASGPRLVYRDVDALALVDHVSRVLQQDCARHGFSGWHVLFPDAAQSALWQHSGAHRRSGCQFHWFNRGYRDFADFLDTFSSRKRKNLKKERQRVSAQGIELQRLTGAAINDRHWQLFEQFYRRTYARLSGHGGYLSGDFFSRLAALRDQVLLVLAWQHGEPVAGALYFFSSTTLYGRYWGAVRDIDQLHFEACYYQGIEFCIERGLQRFDPGAQGEHKIQRGFEPVETCSWHWLAHAGLHQAIGQFVADEAVHIDAYRQQAAGLLPFRQTH